MAGHEVVEKNSILLAVAILIVVSVAAMIEIIPLYFVKGTVEKVEGMRPYTPLELAGRDIYVREGCYLCHTQMVRPFRDEVERYGHYSLAAESMYDHPFQWGSKRTGPDLARVGNKYSDKWHRDHVTNPRTIVPESVMPGYPFLREAEVEGWRYKDRLWANSVAGVPYNQEMMDNAEADLAAQAGDPDSDAAQALKERYKVEIKDASGNVVETRYPQIRDFDGNPNKVTELDALIAYLQMLGTLVDFKTYEAKANFR